MSTAIARPPFDPELGAVLGLIQGQLPTVTSETIPLLRAASAASATTDEDLAKAGLTRRDLTIPGHEGADIVVSVIARADHTGTGPGIYHMHGGGMVAGNRMIGIGQQVVPWVVEHDAVLVTVEYRLAPEFPDPYPLEDCYAGLLWTVEHAAELGIDPDRLLIAGASAGGGLTAGVALMARDRQGPKLIGQVLVCPFLDDRDESISTLQFAETGTWNRTSNQTAWQAYVGDRRGTDEVSIYAAPARATDLSGLPPTYVDCGGSEIFRDESIAYATALWHAGVSVELHVWAGGFHGFDEIAPHTAVGQAAIATRNDWVGRLFGSASS